MNYDTYELFKGDTQAGFAKAVGKTSVSQSVADYTINAQDAVWGAVKLPWTLQQTSVNSTEFTETGAKLKADISIGSYTDLPHHLLHTQTEVQNAIYAVDDTYVGAGAYSTEFAIYHNDLRGGATVSAVNGGVEVNVFGNHGYELSLVETPHFHS